MIKKEKGITLVALVLTIVVILMAGSVGIAMIVDNKNTVVTAEKIAKNKTYQDYKSALEMAISKKQLQSSTKMVDEEFLKDLINIIKDEKQFNGYNNIELRKKNEIYIETKEGYIFLIDIDLVIHELGKASEESSIDNSSETPDNPDDTDEDSSLDIHEEEVDVPNHSYFYYDLTNNSELEGHPRVTGTYEKRCRYHEDEHESHVITENVVETSTCNKHGKKRYTCTCGNYYDSELPFTDHKYHFYTVKYSTDKRNLVGNSHPTAQNTHYYINCEYCGKFRNGHLTSKYKYNAASGTNPHYVTCEYQDTASGTCYMANTSGGSTEKKYSSVKHRCSSCGNVDNLDSRCNSRTSHKHYCNLCYTTGSNSNTSHKCRNCGITKGTAGGCYNHVCSCGTTWRST